VGSSRKYNARKAKRIKAYLTTTREVNEIIARNGMDRVGRQKEMESNAKYFER